MSLFDFKFWLFTVLFIFTVLISSQYIPTSTYENSDIKSRLSNRQCQLYSRVKRDVKCYFYRTHERGGFSLPLALIRQNVDKLESQRHLLIALSGGPGQGFMTNPEEIQAWAAKLERERIDVDLLLYDMRGTGDGKGKVHCQQYDENILDLLQLQLPPEEEIRHLKESLRACVSRVNKQLDKLAVPNLRFEDSAFSTQQNVKDLTGIINALGYTNVHLFGVSYGTRVALATAHIEQVNTLILDSPYPFHRGSDGDMFLNIVNSLDLHLTLYAEYETKKNRNNSGTKKIKEDYESLFKQALGILEQQPPSIHAETWNEGLNIDFQLTPHRLIDLSVHVLYSPYLYTNYYSGLNTFVTTGHVNEALHMVVEHFASTILDPTFNAMVYFATECSDNASENPGVLEKLALQHPLYRDYLQAYIGQNPCDIFTQLPHQIIKDLPITDKPIVAFSGRFDPVTPQAWALELADRAPQMTFVNAKKAGHAPLSGGSCSWSFLNAYVHQQIPDLEINCNNLHSP